MAESVTLSAQRRDKHGTHSARRLRKQGWLPAVVYGHKEETVSISIPRDAFAAALRHGHRIVDLQTDGKTEKTLIRDIQWDPFGQEILHVDFARVSADERVFSAHGIHASSRSRFASTSANTSSASSRVYVRMKARSSIGQ